MRARSEAGDLSVHAIAGTHVVILGLDFKGHQQQSDSTVALAASLTELAISTRSPSSTRIESKDTSEVFVGFAIDREDILLKQSISLNAGGRPIQKFHFGDYTTLPGRQYEYTVRRMINSPASGSTDFTTHGSSVKVKVTTEDPASGKHGIYFNRGVAGSKAYSEKFGDYKRFHLVRKFGEAQWTSTINPRAIPDPGRSKEALTWLSRGLEEALLSFISQSTAGDSLFATVYEFTHEETIQAFASAVERGVDVRIIRHCKGSYHARVKRNAIVKDERGKVINDWVPDGVTKSAKQAIDRIGFKEIEHAHKWQYDTFIERKHSSGIMHNKFIILVKDGKPVQVWTGSTNPTDGGIYGQSNVGHIVRDENVASQYLKYWKHLSKDPPGRQHSGATSTEASKDEHEPIDELNEQEQPDLEGPITSGLKVIFSPRKSTSMLQWYADRMGDAKSSVQYTAAFGVAQPIAKVLNGQVLKGKEVVTLRRSPRLARQTTSSQDSFLRYILLDNKPSEHSSGKKRDGAEKKGNEYIDYYDFKHNPENRIAFGAVLPTKNVGTNVAGNNGESLTGLTTFVDYVHLKICLVDALTDNPLVITGSANFSAASTDKNDENSLVIQGDKSVADVYFTEFMRLFDHFYSRDKYNEAVGKKNDGPDETKRAWGDVVEDESWLRPYFNPSSQLYRERLLLR